ncbi:uncharacterized protein sS8_1888 [Methylocaldum marinum]|uniref:Metalloprotease TldD/E C-terminal domain-containing protein n=1 Tax=Methylocaldum marinum TaxID=1432792 RepID=A0A250KQM9_9GAMM|nr:metallopeptidase TldD-related protein [Methylocaldum marinum]BBA33842.1 uncharacterized protein sS8_1888 [Methylocaldum marinum]
MSFVPETRRLFDDLADTAFSDLKAGEALSLQLSAEDQTYVRFNDSKVRQATAVLQRNLALTFQWAGRQVTFTFDLGGHVDRDRALLFSCLERARQEARTLPEDPFAVPLQNHGTSAHEHSGSEPDAADAVGAIARVTQGTDFTGLLASGPQVRAVRNSAGLNHWFSTASLWVDYSLFTTNTSGDNKAVKDRFWGPVWNEERFQTLLNADKDRLAFLKRPSRAIAPGEYRVYFAPAAVADLVAMFSWGALSYRAYRDGNCALKRLIQGEATLSELFTLKENFGLALTPRFNSLGELPPVELMLIEKGQLKNLLVSSRSAKQYGVPSNAADPTGWFGEHLRAPELMPGNLPETEVLNRLGTGLYVSNLHYLNWSDVQAARVTGMTRYACFWVENGEIAAPIDDLRFDDSLYRVFGSALEALTRESPVHPDIDTYHSRALGGSKIPGALVGAFRFTL